MSPTATSEQTVAPARGSRSSGRRRRVGGGPLLLDFSLVAPGGSSTHAKGFLVALAAAPPPGVDLLVALPGDPEVLAEEEVALTRAGVATARIGTLKAAGTWPSRVSGQVALPRLVRRVDPSIVFIAREVGPLALRRPNVLFAANVLHWGDKGVGHQSMAARGVSWLKAAVARRAVERTELVIAPTQRIADLLPPGVDRVVVPLGVDVARVGAKPVALGERRPLRAVVLSSILRHKRMDVLVGLVAALVRDHGVDATLDIWGGAPDPELADRLADQLREQLGDRGRLRGYLDPADRQEMLAEADVFLLGSGTESFGFPIIEAMRTSTLVVAPDAELTREICGETAIFYPEGDALAGAELLARALQPARASEIEAMVERAQERSLQFTWERCVIDTIAILEQRRELLDR